MPTAVLGGTAAASGIALINSVGNLGGFGGPYLVGLVKSATGDFTTPLLVLAAIVAAGGILAILLPITRLPSTSDST
jgi:ACS family tartrate transporter-like MFS transporter